MCACPYPVRRFRRLVPPAGSRGSRITLRRVRAFALPLVALALALAACTPSSEGSVVGGVLPCLALAIAPPGPHYVAAIITVVKGSTSWKPSGAPGTFVVVFPATVVAKETVGTNETYSFDLPPGRYVLRASYLMSANVGVSAWADVTVTAGTTEYVDVSDRCI